jgi:DNA-directed RNA polymerase specialized sigma24 family protein
MDTQEELVRLHVLNLRRSVANQTEAILELDSVGFGPSRIAELLGTTPGTVNVTLQKAKRRRRGRNG